MMDLRPVGDTGWLLEPRQPGPTVDDIAVARVMLNLAAAVHQSALSVVDVIPAARTVLVTTAPQRHAEVGAALARLTMPVGAGSVAAVPVGAASELVVTFTVVFDGEDIDDTATSIGQTRGTLVDRVLRSTWLVAFGGFAPGFAYLVGAGLDVPRLASPRSAVPAGSLALAGPYAAVYPRDTPGGWRLIGRIVDGPDLFDPERDPPALLVPGTTVMFAPAR